MSKKTILTNLFIAMPKSRWDDIKQKRRDSPWIGVPAQNSLNWKSNFLWGLDPTDHPLLTFEANCPISPLGKLPTLSGVECHNIHTEVNSKLVFRLTDLSLVDIFDNFIDFLVLSVDCEVSETAVYSRLLSKAWRWHYLLKAGSSRLLSSEEQKGLIAEVNLLQYWLSPQLGIGSAISSWTGPSGSPKDFESSSFCIEVKARRPGAVDGVQISSSDQLADVPGHELILAVFNIDLSETVNTSSFTFNEWIERARTFVKTHDPMQISKFDELLYEVGFDENDEYPTNIFISVSDSRFFRVNHLFPRIVPSMHSANIDHVKYRLSLNSLDDYAIDSKTFIELIRS